MIEEVHLPHQMMVPGEAGTVHIVVGIELYLASPIQPLRARTSWRRAVISVKKGLPTMAWGLMQRVRPYSRFLSHPSSGGLTRLNFLISFLSRCLQWRLQEFCPGCSYSTLKKFRVISVYFGCFGMFR